MNRPRMKLKLSRMTDGEDGPSTRDLQVRKADPVPASSLNTTQRQSGRVRLPDLQIAVASEM